MEVSSQPHIPATLQSGKKPQYPFNRRLGGPHSHCGHLKKKNLFPHTKIQTVNHPNPLPRHYINWVVARTRYTSASLIQILPSHLCVCQQVDLEWRFHRKTLLTDRALVRCNTKTHITETQLLYFTNHMMHQDFRMEGHHTLVLSIFGPK